MSKRAFGKYYYSMEDTYSTKVEAQRAAGRFRATGKYYVRVAKTGMNVRGREYWAVYLRSK